MMDRESWITSKEAYELGFSTTQTKNEPMQALEANFIYNLVMQNKDLQNQIEEKANKMAENTSQEGNKVNEDAWTSFFNIKKQEKEGKKYEI